MTITIENADENILSIIKSLKKLSPKIKVKKESKLAKELAEEEKEILRAYKSNSLKTYKNMQEFREFNNV